jgi:hypothetical protein
MFFMISPQYITDEKGTKLSVVLPINVYNKILEDLEELEDIKLYDEVKSRKEESTPIEEYLEARKNRKNGDVQDSY